MIAFDFAYYRPATVREAVEVYSELSSQGCHPVYYGGGTETISLARIGSVRTGAVIDLKAIPECCVLEYHDGRLVIGAANTLSRIAEAGLFGLLGETAARIADHSTQCKITLGGNLAGSIRYREAALPLLLADSELLVTGPRGDRRVTLASVFRGRLRLGEGEFVVWVETARGFLALPHVHQKWTRLGKIGYPLVTLCAARADGHVRMAFSGVCADPFRSPEMETALNAKDGNLERRVDAAIGRLPSPAVDEFEGSGPFRRYVLKSALMKGLGQLGVS